MYFVDPNFKFFLNFLSGNRPDRGLIPYEPLLIPSLVLGCASLNIAPARVGEERRRWLLSGLRIVGDGPVMSEAGNFNAVVVKGDGAGFHDEDAGVLAFWGGGDAGISQSLLGMPGS